MPVTRKEAHDAQRSQTTASTGPVACSTQEDAIRERNIALLKSFGVDITLPPGTALSSVQIRQKAAHGAALPLSSLADPWPPRTPYYAEIGIVVG